MLTRDLDDNGPDAGAVAILEGATIVLDSGETRTLTGDLLLDWVQRRRRSIEAPCPLRSHLSDNVSAVRLTLAVRRCQQHSRLSSSR